MKKLLLAVSALALLSLPVEAASKQWEKCELKRKNNPIEYMLFGCNAGNDHGKKSEKKHEPKPVDPPKDPPKDCKDKNNKHYGYEKSGTQNPGSRPSRPSHRPNNAPNGQGQGQGPKNR